MAADLPRRRADVAIIPINNVALGTLPPERLKNASGLYNLMRNLGGAVGLAGLTTILNDRTDLHLERLHEAITFARRPAVETLDQLTQHFHNFGSDAHDMALKALDANHPRQGPGHGLCRPVPSAGHPVRGAGRSRPW